jgi:hypothetical protein
VILDFQGDLGIETLREYLRNDDSREAKAILAKVVADGGVDDMMLVLADCLIDTVRNALNDDVIRKNLSSYAES